MNRPVFPSPKFIAGLYGKRRFQLDFIELFNQRKYRHYMLKWARRHGKSTMCWVLLIKNCLENPNSRSAFIFTTSVAAGDIVTKDPTMMSMLPKQKGDKGPFWWLNRSEKTITFHNGSVLQLYGADKPRRCRGIAADLVVIDEWAQHRSDELFKEVIEPIIRNNPKASCIYIYTPRGITHASEMWDRALSGEAGDGWYCNKLTAEDSKLLPYEQLMEAKKAIGELSYRQEYLCEDNADDTTVILPQKMISNLEKVRRTQKYLKRCIAFDPALGGGDEAVLYYMENSEVLREKIVTIKDATVLEAEVLLFADKCKCNHIVMDSAGLGQPIYHHLRKRSKKVIPMDARAKAVDSDRFHNLKSEVWFHSRLMMEQGKIPPIIDSVLKKQLSAVRYKWSGSRNRIICEPKEDTRKRLGQSPDRADAFVMGVWAYDKLPDENRYNYTARIDRNRICGHKKFNQMAM